MRRERFYTLELIYIMWEIGDCCDLEAMGLQPTNSKSPSCGSGVCFKRDYKKVYVVQDHCNDDQLVAALHYI